MLKEEVGSQHPNPQGWQTSYKPCKPVLVPSSKEI